MQLTHVILHRVQLPLITPFRTSSGRQTMRDALIVQVVGPDTEGWGECVAETEPTYTAEYTNGAHEVMIRFLLPRINGSAIEASDVANLLAPVKGHPMAKGAIEAAVLDAECRRTTQSMSARLGGQRERVMAGVAVGIHPSIGSLIAAVEGYVAQGYKRVKLKIEPSHDVTPVAAVREAFPELALQVDANGSYRLSDAPTLAQLDAFNLLMIEQPLPEHDFRGHAELGRHLRTPLCLDESITSMQSADHAIAVGACQIINIKPGRVGGLLEAVRIHDLCLGASIPVWCGGMLETGIGRAGNVALASLPGFTLPGDLSASERYFHHDVTDAFVLEDGYLRVPSGPGIGVNVLTDRLAEFTVSTETISLDG